MKVAYIVGDFVAVSETFILDLVNGLSQRVDSLTVVCNLDNSSRNGVSLQKRVQIKESKFRILSSYLDRCVFRLMRLIGKRSEFYRYQMLQRQAVRRLKPVLSDLKPDVVYVDYGTVASEVIGVLRELNIPFVVHFHGYDISRALSDFAYRQELQVVFQQAKSLIVASHHIRRLLVLEGAPMHKIQVIRLGINLEGLPPKSWGDRKCFPPAIVFLGRFTPKKHPVALIEAFALVKNCPGGESFNDWRWTGNGKS